LSKVILKKLKFQSYKISLEISLVTLNFYPLIYYKFSHESLQQL